MTSSDDGPTYQDELEREARAMAHTLGYVAGSADHLADLLDEGKSPAEIAERLRQLAQRARDPHATSSTEAQRS